VESLTRLICAWEGGMAFVIDENDIDSSLDVCT